MEYKIINVFTLRDMFVFTLCVVMCIVLSEQSWQIQTSARTAFRRHGEMSEARGSGDATPFAPTKGFLF